MDHAVGRNDKSSVATLLLFPRVLEEKISLHQNIKGTDKSSFSVILFDIF